eukprot:CAMPEP_0177769642 /NCGR_PEP_ID=MMETSP0491_2-20121128/10446_1 /TAXON_ID=63592 /ORGANISM="Tetraselmis chuii, Strain PLY429" /LENGTH=819 /DNA_ID=CAMNT_0019286695 /DNA_START=108 /DNA_END=2564 /DNA_ORIENTATION=-
MDKLDAGEEDLVHVPTRPESSPAAVQRYAEEDGGRWLDPPPSHVATRAREGSRGGWRAWGGLSSRSSGRSDEELPCGMMSGDEGGLIPGGPSSSPSPLRRRRSDDDANSNAYDGLIADEAEPMSPHFGSTATVLSGSSSLQSSTTNGLQLRGSSGHVGGEDEEAGEVERDETSGQPPPPHITPTTNTDNSTGNAARPAVAATRELHRPCPPNQADHPIAAPTPPAPAPSPSPATSPFHPATPAASNNGSGGSRRGRRAPTLYYPPHGPDAQRLRRMADSLAAARLLCLEDMAKLHISPAAAHAEAKGTWGGAILRAVGSGRGGPAAAAVAASVATRDTPNDATSPTAAFARRFIRLPSALRGVSGVTSSREEEDESLSAESIAAGYSSDQVLAAVWQLFEPMESSPAGTATPVLAAPGWRGPAAGSGSAELAGWSLEAEVGGAPASGLLAAIVSAMCRLQTVGQMAQLWAEVVEELRLHWRSLRPVPLVPEAEPPRPRACLLQQRLQLLNVAIAHCRLRQQRARRSPSAEDSCRAATGGAEGASHILPGELKTASGSGEVLWAPELQTFATFHAELCQDFTDLAQCVHGPRAVLQQALSDMSAFRAANPSAQPADYSTWCAAEGRSHPRQLDTLLSSTPACDLYPLRHLPHAPTSPRAPPCSPSNWEDLFWSAPPMAAARQVPLFRAEAVGAAVLEAISAQVPSDVFEQLFLVAVVMEYAGAAACPLLQASPPLQAALHEVAAFAGTACGRGMGEHKVARICNVFDRLQDIFLAAQREQQASPTCGSVLPLSFDPASSSEGQEAALSMSKMEVDMEDEW